MGLILFADTVEFAMSYDRRTGKPVAIVVTSLASTNEVVSDQVLLGTVLTPPPPVTNPSAAVRLVITILILLI